MTSNRETPWTPGPWAHDDSLATEILGPDRYQVAEVYWSQLYADYDKSRHPSDNSDWNRELSDEELVANARLIAAAPEMAELAEMTVRNVPPLMTDDDIRASVDYSPAETERIIMARALLSRIYGEQSDG